MSRTGDGRQPSAALDVISLLVPERAALVDLLASLAPDEWETPTECPAWSVKGVALHLLGDDLSLVSRQRDDATNGLFLYAEDHPGLGFRELLDGFNEQWVRAASFLSIRLIIDLLTLTGDWSEQFYRSVNPDAPGEPVGFFAAPGPSPWWQVTAREYVERWVHHSQIRRALGHPPVDVPLAEPAMEAVVAGFGARIPELGRFCIGERYWEFRDGAEVRLEDADTALVLSRGLTREATKAALEGDPAAVEAVAAQTCRTD